MALRLRCGCGSAASARLSARPGAAAGPSRREELCSAPGPPAGHMTGLARRRRALTVLPAGGAAAGAGGAREERSRRAAAIGPGTPPGPGTGGRGPGTGGGAREAGVSRVGGGAALKGAGARWGGAWEAGAPTGWGTTLKGDTAKEGRSA